MAEPFVNIVFLRNPIHRTPSYTVILFHLDSTTQVCLQSKFITKCDCWSRNSTHPPSCSRTYTFLYLGCVFKIGCGSSVVSKIKITWVALILPFYMATWNFKLVPKVWNSKTPPPNWKTWCFCLWIQIVEHIKLLRFIWMILKLEFLLNFWSF